jgi:hypothetical protein
MTDPTLDPRAPTRYAARMFDRIEHTHIPGTGRLLALTVACMWDRGEKPMHLDAISRAANVNKTRTGAHWHDLERSHLIIWHPIEGWVPGPAITHPKPTEATQIASFLPHDDSDIMPGSEFDGPVSA